MANIVSFQVTTSNPQHKDRALGETSISGASLKDSDNITRFYAFKDDEGEDGNLIIPTGGLLELDIDEEIGAYNYALYKRLKAAGRIPIELGLTVNEKGAAMLSRKKNRDLYRQVEDLLSALAESNLEEYQGLAIRLGMADVNNSSLEEITDFLLTLAYDRPEFVFAEVNNPDKDLFFLLDKAKNILKVEAGGIYFKNSLLGFSELAAISTLKQNPEILKGLRAELSRAQPVLTYRVEPTFEDDEEEDEALKLKEQRGRISDVVALDAKDAFDLALEKQVIQHISPGVGKRKIYIYSGREISVEKSEVIEFLEKNEQVRKEISALK